MSVTAAPGIQARLLDLQGLDTALTRLAADRKRVEQGDDLLKVAAERAALRRTDREQRDEVDDLRIELRRTESDVEMVEQRLKRDQQRLAQTSSAKDAQSFEQEIESLLRRRSTLEDTELEVMERLEAAETILAETATALRDLESRGSTLQTARDAALVGILEQEQRLLAQRAELVDDLPSDLVALYERQRSRYGIGAALLRAGVSGGSNMALTGADLAAVRAAAPDAIVLDPESGCILVRTDESGI
jgi:uncharacterized protein